jgi:hypothetical protein
MSQILGSGTVVGTVHNRAEHKKTQNLCSFWHLLIMWGAKAKAYLLGYITGYQI